MRKLLVFMLLKNPLAAFLLGLVMYLFGSRSDGQPIQVSSIGGVTFIVGISFLFWDVLLISIPYYLFTRKNNPSTYSLFVVGMILHVPVALLSFFTIDQEELVAITLSSITSTLVAGWIYKIVIENKWQIIKE